MRLKPLIGVGDRIFAFTLPFAVVAVAANGLWPSAFTMGLGTGALVAGVILLALGVPLWLWTVVQIVVHVPRGRLITSGGFALVLHPLYCSVALLVIPGCGLVFDSWAGPAIGAVMYAATRLFAGREDRQLAEMFPKEYAAYRARVLLPWV